MDMLDMLNIWNIILDDYEYRFWCVKHKNCYSLCPCLIKSYVHDVYHPGVIDDILDVYLGEK